MSNLEVISGMIWMALSVGAHAGRARWGRGGFRGLLFVGALLAVLAHLIPGDRWLGEGLFFAVALLLLMDLLFAETRRWWSWLLVGLALLTPLALGAWLLATQLPPAVPSRISLSVVALALVGGLGLAVQQLWSRFGFVRVAMFVCISLFTDLLLFAAFNQNAAIDLPSRLAMLLGGIVLAAWYLDRSNLAQTMSVAQRAAFDSLLGTVEALAGPENLRLTQERLISTLVTTTQALVSGAEDGWQRLLSSAVMLVPGAEGGSIRVRSGDEFRFVAQRGFGDDLIGLAISAEQSRDWHGDGLAWHRGEPRILERPFESDRRPPLDADPRFSSAATRSIRANLYLPVVVDNTVMADINLDNFSHANAFTEESVQTARQFALQLAALLKAQLEREKLESRLREFEFLELVTSALHNAHTGARIAESVVTETVRLMSSPHAAVLLISNDGTRLQVSSARGNFTPITAKAIPWGHGLSWAAIHAQETIVSPDAPADPRATDVDPNGETPPYAQLTVPMLDSSGAPLGVLMVARDLPQGFSPLDQRLVEVIARVAAGALERVRVTRDLQRQVQESLNLLSLAQLLEGNDAQSLEGALERVRQLGGADAALLLTQHGDRLQPKIQVGYFSDSLSQVLLEGLPLDAESQRSFETTDEGQEPAQAGLRRLGARTAFNVPVNLSAGATGTLVLYRYTRANWSAAERHTLEAAARMLGALLGRLERLQTLETAYSSALKTIGLALEMRDLETANHTERVAQLAEAVARELDLSESEVRAVRWGAYLHDIGKFGLRDAILRKPSALTQAETLEMRRHPGLGFGLIRDLPFLPEASRQIVLFHHERWDGTGYPEGLRGERIPLAARIFAVCDVFDALRSKRVYKEAFSLEHSLEELHQAAQIGQLELRLVRALEAVVRRQNPAAPTSV